MKIKSLHIENFGKLSGLDIQFDANLTEICRQNGWGKSTLSIFLKAMFYGMAKKGNNRAYNSERSKFKPWQSGIYGGYVIFEVEDKAYRVTRTFADTPEGDTFELVDLATGLKSKDYSKEIGQELFGVGVETFEITAFFPQSNFASGMTDEMRVNMTGLNKFENDLENLASAQKVISLHLREIKQNKPKQTDIDRTKRAINDCERLIKVQKQESEELEKEVEKLQSSLTEKSDLIKSLRAKQEKFRSAQQDKQSTKDKLLSLQETMTALVELKNNENQENSSQENIIQARNSAVQGKNKVSLFGSIITPIVALVLVGILIGLGLSNTFSFTLALALSVIILIIDTTVEFYFIKNLKRKNKENLDLPSDKMKNGEENNNFANQIQSLKEQIENLKTQLEEFEIPSFDEEEFENLKDERAKIDREKVVNEQKFLSLQREIERNYENYEKLQDDYESMLKNKVEMTRAEDILYKTKDMLLKAQENVSARFAKPIKEAFSKVFDAVAGEKKGKISIDINMAITENSPSGEKEFEYLSQGYRDAISICQRFALLDTIYLKEKPFVLLDDPFVNLDEEKRKVLSGIVKDFSKTYQTIYLHCHERNGVE
jgi:DNA repair exonuclease SbcCD ATPase subunit